MLKREYIRNNLWSLLAFIISFIALFIIIIGVLHPLYWSTWRPTQAGIIDNQSFSLFVIVLSIIFFILFVLTKRSFIIFFILYQIFFIYFCFEYYIPYIIGRIFDAGLLIGMHLVFFGLLMQDISSFVWLKEKAKYILKGKKIDRIQANQMKN
jgi:hypothetical protein